nr:hypothetical protein [uncultured Pseudomonas sp.]
MTVFIRLLVILGVALVPPVYADSQAPQAIRVIPITTISPGASGSIGGSQHYEQHNLYGGQRLPGDGTLRRYESHSSSQTVESRGAIRQSVEYPGGYKVQTLPGQSSQQYQRSR